LRIGDAGDRGDPGPVFRAPRLDPRLRFGSNARFARAGQALRCEF